MRTADRKFSGSFASLNAQTFHPRTADEISDEEAMEKAIDLDPYGGINVTGKPEELREIKEVMARAEKFEADPTMQALIDATKQGIN